MSLPKERIIYLLEAYTSQRATAQEEQELMEWMQEAQENSELQIYVQNLWDQYRPQTDFSNVNWDGMFDRITQNNKVFSIAPEPKTRHIRWPRIAAAAAVLLLIATGSYFLLTQKQSRQTVAKTQRQELLHKDVAPPAGNKATLTLANGKVIILDSAGMGSLVNKGAANASKLNEGELVYAPNTEMKLEYHTLNVPKGSRPMQLHLADGSEVWLNSASSIRFPNVFNGGARKVVITGEVYFEVAKVTGKGFLVEANGATTEVLGTHFNVNAYENEPGIKVTLLEGAVNVRRADQSAKLAPGQQAILRSTQDDRIEVASNVNIEEVMAWKNGTFEFNETDIQSVMRQIERWYDVEVVFEGSFTQHFNGTIPRQANVSRILNMLEKTGGVRFSIDGKKILVKKY
ncbi:MAG: DUF4974 domain-containing protein [Chitinophagaceae bacterium]|nr:DUF4974 domain-containing protein [Chitinophagaceae bacterium]